MTGNCHVRFGKGSGEKYPLYAGNSPLSYFTGSMFEKRVTSKG